MVVATALCADRVASAAPDLCPQPVRSEAQVPQVVQLAGRLVSSLSRRFQRVVPSALMPETRQSALAAALCPRRLLPDQSLQVQTKPLSPFQFRLPPPLA